MHIKPKIKEVIVVEGRYDANIVRAAVEATVVELKGFGLFKNKKLLSMLRTYADTKGLILLTDPDGAGFVLRNWLKGSIDPSKLKHAYIPKISGRCKRKKEDSSVLGVENMDILTIRKALSDANATGDFESKPDPLKQITRTDLYEDGLYGGCDSVKLRQRLYSELSLPELSVTALCDFINATVGKERYEELVRQIKSEVNRN